MRDRIRCSFAVVVMFLLLLASGSGPVATANPPARTYTLIDLGTLGGLSSWALDINDRGQVVGYSNPAGGSNDRAFLWEASTGMQDLGTLGGPDSLALGINARGQVVGYSNMGPPNSSHAFLWEAGSGMQDLGTMPSYSFQSFAFGINARGQVVGASAATNEGPAHAFLWEAGTGMQDLGALGGSDSAANRINARGQVVGYNIVAGGFHAFLWEPGTGMQDLGGGSTATGINNRGQVVGYNTVAGTAHAFLWEPSTGMQDLGTLGGLSLANGINERSQVVGESVSDPATGERHAFLWEASTGMQDLGTLETLGGRFSVADAINERGQIVGRALTAGGIHAVLWDPVGCVTPSITSVRATPNLIWPPNHKMVPLSVVADAHAVCGPPVCTILSIASDGPTDRITDDTAITGNLTALVRAERSGASMGRTYTITVECDDTAGNAATGTTLVRVPHDQGK